MAGKPENGGKGEDSEAFALAHTEMPEAPAEFPTGSSLSDTDVADATVLAPLATGDQGEIPVLRSIPRDRYAIDVEIARGGMGRILSAHDRHLLRPVAIKELLHGSESSRARFEREALITARLQHPAIVPLYEAGRWPDGEPFYAMKMVSGAALDVVVKQCKNREERIALLPRLIDVADALAYAHSEGVIHRDLKPANVLIGGFGETVVIDWGLAKDLGVDDVDDDTIVDRPRTLGGAELTVLGHAMGTPAYMAPEQARGEKVGKHADVYALGAMLYHVLGGRMAYAESNSAQEILEKVLAGPPEPLEERDPSLPPALIAIASKAMARKREHRYADAAEFAEELRRFEAGQLVSAHDYSLRELALRWIRRHRGLVISTSIMLAILVGFGFWSLQQLRIERDQAMKAEAQAMEARSLAMKERKAAVEKSLQLSLAMASEEAKTTPTDALLALDGLDGLDEYPHLVEEARLIAAQARSQRIPRHLTERGAPTDLLEVSPGSRTAAIRWHEGTIALVDIDTGTRRLLDPPGNDLGEAKRLRFAANGTTLAASYETSESIFIWDLETESKPRSVPIGQRYLYDFQLSASGRRLAAIVDRRLMLIDLEGPSAPVEIEHDIESIWLSHLAFSPDGKTLAVAADGAFLLDIERGVSRRVAEGYPNSVQSRRSDSFTAVKYSPIGDTVMFADHRVLLVTTATGTSRKLFETSEEILALAYSSDGKTIAAGGKDANVYVHYSDHDDAAIVSLAGHTNAINGLEFAHGNQRLVSSAERGKLISWELGWLGHRLSRRKNEVVTERLSATASQLSHDETTVVGFGSRGELLAWNIEHSDLETLGEIDSSARSIFDIANETMAWTRGGISKEVGLRFASGEERSLGEHDEQINLLTISSDGRFVAVAGNRLLSLWDTQTGTHRRLLGHDAFLRGLRFVPDALISIDFSGTVFRWNLESGDGERLVEGNTRIAGFVGTVVDPKGKWVAMLDVDRNIVLHDLEHSTSRLMSEGKHVAGLGVSPDGDWMAFSVDPSKMLVFATRKQAPPVVLHSPIQTEKLQHPTFSRDGSMLVASNGESGLRLWKAWNDSADSVFLRGAGTPSHPSFSSDGSRLVASERDINGFTVWHVASERHRSLRTLGLSERARFWPEGKTIVCGTWGGRLQLWKDDLPTTWRELQQWIATQIESHRRMEQPSR